MQFLPPTRNYTATPLESHFTSLLPFRLIYHVSGTAGHSLTFLGRLPSAYGVNTPLVEATLESSLSVSETTNKFPERHLFAINFRCCLLTHGIFFLCGTTTYLCLPTNWRGTCTLVYLAPEISIAPNNQTLPIPLTHNRPRQAIQFYPLLISLGMSARIGTGTAGLTTSLNYYLSLSEDLTDSLEEIANSLITIQNQLDSLATMVLQNRRGLDLTAEKGGLCLFLEEACWFYTNKSGIVKEAARNLTNGLENTPTHQQYMGKLGKQLELDVLGPTFSSSSPFIYPNSNFLLMFNVSFFKISSGSLTSLHQPNYPQATSNSI